MPVAAGGRIVVEAVPDQSELQLAAAPDGAIVRSVHTLESALDEIKPALRAVLNQLGSIGSDEVRIDFGLRLGAETGIVVARGTTAVHFSVSLTRRRDAGAVPTPHA